MIASVAATGVGLAAMWGQHAVAPALHPRVAGLPVLALFSLTYLAVAWWMGSAEAARWLRLRQRVPASGAAHGR